MDNIFSDTFRLVISVVGSDDPNYLWKGMFLGFVLLVFTTYQFCVAHNYFKYCTIMAMNGRSSVISAVYRKVSWAIQETSTRIKFHSYPTGT